MASKFQHNKGKIRDNALKALVRSNLFRHKQQAGCEKMAGRFWQLSRLFLRFKRGNFRRSRMSL